MTPDRTLDGSAPPAPPATPRPFHPLVAVGLGLVVGIVIARLARR
jgi:hypothetical protein